MSINDDTILFKMNVVMELVGKFELVRALVRLKSCSLKHTTKTKVYDLK